MVMRLAQSGVVLVVVLLGLAEGGSKRGGGFGLGFGKGSEYFEPQWTHSSCTFRVERVRKRP